LEKGKNGLSQYLVWIIFFAVLCGHLFLAVQWQRQFFAYFVNSCHSFMDAVSLAYQDVVNSHRGFSIFYKFNWQGVGTYWPPVVFIMGLGTLLSFSVPWFFLPNFFYLAMIMLGIYCSTRFLTGNNFYSMLAAVIFSCYWFVMIQLVSFELQLASTACIVWGFYWYLRSCFFTRFLPSLLVGLFMALGLYCDRILPGFFIFSLFLVPENFKDKRSWLLMALALATGVLWTWPFYEGWCRVLSTAETRSVLFGYGSQTSSPVELLKAIGHNPRFLMAHFSYYFIALTEQLLGYGFTALLVLGIFLLHRMREKSYVWVLSIALLIPLMAFISSPKKDYIYIFPLCPYLAIISGLGIYFVRRKWLRYLLMLLIAGLAVQQYFVLFSSPPSQGRRSWFFSNQFEKMRDQRIPGLFLLDYPFSDKNTAKETRSIVDQISLWTHQPAALGEQKQTVIVDLKRHSLQHSVVFLMRIKFPKVKTINAFYLIDPIMDKKSSDEHWYLLSDKEQYAAEKGPWSGGGRTWKDPQLLYQFPKSQITLYRVEQ
jgi:hypothetical protein